MFDGDDVVPQPVLDILYEDESIVAVHKPAGLMVHRSYVDTGATQFLLQLLRDQINCRVYPVHRLDRPTSGVIVFAKSSEVAATLTAQFTERTISKTYQALVRGYMLDEGEIDYPLSVIKDKKTPRKYISAAKPAQPAVTLYKQLCQYELPYPSGKFSTSRYSLVELRPLTGRTHQIRRHLKHVFHPIIGDTRYGDHHHTSYFRETFDSHRLLLAATKIAFQHPLHQTKVMIDCPLEASFSDVLRQLALGSLMQ